MQTIGSATHVIGATSIANRVVPDVDFFLDNQATSNTQSTTVEKFLASLSDVDCVRIAILPGGVTTNVPAGDIVLYGLAWDAVANNFIEKTVNVTLAADQATKAVSSVPFKRLDKIIFPVQDGAGVTYDVGIDNQVLFKIPVRNETGIAIASLRTITSGVAASENLLFTLDSIHGGNSDVNLYSVNLTTPATQADIKDFAVPQILVPGDVLSISYANTNSLTVAIQVVGLHT